MPLLSRASLRATATTAFALCAVTLLLTGCDSGGDEGPAPQQSEFVVRYELDGTCSGIRIVSYNVTGNGASNGSTVAFTLPWSFEHTVSAPTSPTATALSATCQGSSGAAQTLTGRILVDGEVRANQTAAGQDQVNVTISTVLR